MTTVQKSLTQVATRSGSLHATLSFVVRDTSAVKVRLAVVYAIIAALNVGTWCWALIEFRDKPSLLGIAVLVYGLGLRHAVDADHIAAIDNVTRKLMQAGQRPIGVGFWFAIGHSAIVILVTGAVISATHLLSRFKDFQDLGGRISASISAAFLFSIAAINIVIFFSMLATFRRVRAGVASADLDIDHLIGRGGFLSRIFRPLFRLVTKSWHMVFLGFLFGLGFDTATEIAMFSISAHQVSSGMSTVSVGVFPLLFAAGMLLVDTTDGVMMLAAYDWAFVKPMRKIYYNMSITLVSAAVAIFIGGVEALGVIDGLLDAHRSRWVAVERLNASFNTLGFVIIGIFVVAWALSYLIYRARRLDAFEPMVTSPPAD